MRIYEPFKRLGRIFVVPLIVAPGTPWFTRTQTWETEGEFRFGPTVVIKFGFLPIGLGVGRWEDTDIVSLQEEYEARQEIEAANAAYDAYVAVHGETDRNNWDAARKHIASQGLDPDEELELMQTLHVFGGEEGDE